MKTRAGLAAVLTAAPLFLAAAIPGTAYAQTQWDMPTGYNSANVHTENVRQFAEDVERLSGGKLKITVHDSASLFRATEIKRAVQGGQAQIGEILLSNFANEDPMFELDTLPLVADSYAEARKLADAERPTLDAKFAKQGMKILYSMPWPPNGIYSAKPLNSAADLKGIKWRAYNPVSGRIAELVGAQPVTIQAAELSQALATGAVEAFNTSGAAGYDSKVWEQLKYFYDLNLMLPKNLVIVNRKAFDALEPDVRDALTKAAAQAETRGWQSSETKNKWFIGQLAEHGMKIEPGSPQLRADMKKVGDTMLAEWLKKAGPDGQAIIEAYRAK